MNVIESQYHYQIIARALEFIREHQQAQPRLEDIARAQNMSSSHFQRVFTDWVGISPKRYVEYLTLPHAKDALIARMGNLAASEVAGLSGTGRLYDLILKWEAVTPGEFARAGEGVKFGWGPANTPFGAALLVANSRGLAALGFLGEEEQDAVLNDFRARWPRAEFARNEEMIAPYAARLETGQGELPLWLSGTPFQIAIWRALLAIPEGSFASYAQIASSIGNKKAIRAAGTAIGRNPLAWLIPCHRAIRTSGALGGYHWGLPVKEAMITYEAARGECAQGSRLAPFSQ